LQLYQQELNKNNLFITILIQKSLFILMKQRTCLLHMNKYVSQIWDNHKVFNTIRLQNFIQILKILKINVEVDQRR
jgi:hypothetical protein